MNEFCMWDKCESLGARGQTVVGSSIPPKMSTFSSLEPVSILLHVKRNFADEFKVTDLKVGRLFWIIQVSTI